MSYFLYWLLEGGLGEWDLEHSYHTGQAAY